MELPDQLLCLFSARVDERNGSYVIEIPDRELAVGDLQDGRTYRVAVLSGSSGSDATRDASGGTARGGTARGVRDGRRPPVEEGERREVEIEDVGDQGDGITRVERGYVVIVPDTEPGERVTIEITDVQENVAFAEVLDRQTHI